MPAYTLQQRIFMYDSYVITSSYSEVVRRFQADYPGLLVPNREAVRLIVNKFKEMGSIINKKRIVKRRMLTEQKLEEIGERLENWPQKSLRRLAQETDISKASAWKATKLLKLKSYKVTVVQELLPRDNQSRLSFFNWILRNVNAGTIDPRLIIFSDEARFHVMYHHRTTDIMLQRNPNLKNKVYKTLDELKQNIRTEINAHFGS